jgi:hypothetical protein
MDVQRLRGLIESFDGVSVVENLGDAFFTYDPDGNLPQDRWLPFATLVTGDHYDKLSDLDSRGSYRLNLGLTKAAYTRLLGAPPLDRDGDGVLIADVDWTGTDVILPHPFYANQYWVCVVDSGPSTMDIVRELLTDAYGFAVRKHINRTARSDT